MSWQRQLFGRLTRHACSAVRAVSKQPAPAVGMSASRAKTAAQPSLSSMPGFQSWRSASAMGGRAAPSFASGPQFSAQVSAPPSPIAGASSVRSSSSSSSAAVETDEDSPLQGTSNTSASSSGLSTSSDSEEDEPGTLARRPDGGGIDGGGRQRLILLCTPTTSTLGSFSMPGMASHMHPQPQLTAHVRCLSSQAERRQGGSSPEKFTPRTPPTGSRPGSEQSRGSASPYGAQPGSGGQQSWGSRPPRPMRSGNAMQEGGADRGNGRGYRGGAGGDRGGGSGWKDGVREEHSLTEKLEDNLLELRVFAQESFLRKQLPVPHAVREVMFAHSWDKLVVDARRSTELVAQKGKVDTYTAMVAVGNMQGLVGLGLAEAGTMQEAVAAAHLDAYTKLVVVPLYRGHTIFHHIKHQYHFITMILKPLPAGRGVFGSDLLSELCNLVGIKDLAVKTHCRRRSRFFLATAFMEALQKQSVPHDGVEGSGVYVREVYHRLPQAQGRQLAM